MFKKILVPLDGSKLAECSLPFTADLASSMGAEVNLVTVTHRTQGFRAEEDPGSSEGVKLIPEASCSIEQQAMNYLDNMGKNLQDVGIKVVKQVLCGKPAEEIIIHAEIEKCDLIVMAAHHERQFPSRLIHGNVAQKVFKGTYVPVMMIRPNSCPISK